MKALVVGCGSIGSRRARLLREMYGGLGLFFYDRDRDRAGELAQKHQGIAVAGGERADYDVVLICTPPDSGRPEQIAQAFSRELRGLYVEKPLALDRSDVDEVRYLLNRVPSRLITMGACNLRFVGGVSGLRKLKRPWQLLSLTMRQHAKFWNPAHQPCSIILDSIHELDLAEWLNGPIESIRGWSKADAAEISLHQEDGALTHIFLDRKGDPPQRRIQIHNDYGRDYTSLDLQVDDNTYRRELQHFMNCVEAGTPTCNPLSDVVQLNLRALEVA